MSTVVPFESRAAKADSAPAPISVGPRRRSRSVRLVAVSSALFGVLIAAAIEAEAFAIAVLLIVAGFLMLRRLR